MGKYARADGMRSPFSATTAWGGSAGFRVCVYMDWRACRCLGVSVVEECRYCPFRYLAVDECPTYNMFLVAIAASGSKDGLLTKDSW
jgi:hypothetical protein